MKYLKLPRIVHTTSLHSKYRQIQALFVLVQETRLCDTLSDNAATYIEVCFISRCDLWTGKCGGFNHGCGMFLCLYLYIFRRESTLVWCFQLVLYLFSYFPRSGFTSYTKQKLETVLCRFHSTYFLFLENTSCSLYISGIFLGDLLYFALFILLFVVTTNLHSADLCATCTCLFML